MLPDRVSNPGPMTYESGALSIALCSPAPFCWISVKHSTKCPTNDYLSNHYYGVHGYLGMGKEVFGW